MVKHNSVKCPWNDKDEFDETLQPYYCKLAWNREF